MKTMAVFALLLAVLGDDSDPRGDRVDARAPDNASEKIAQADARQAKQREEAQLKERVAFITRIASWPTETRMVAENLFNRLGAPDDVTETMVVWYDKAPFNRVLVLRDAVKHNFPIPHTDVVAHEINYFVPVEMVDDVVKLDGSLVINRTAGTLTAYGSGEAMNFIALNLADDVARGRKTVADARRQMHEAAQEVLAGDLPPIAKRIYIAQGTSTRDPDRPMSRGFGRGLGR